MGMRTVGQDDFMVSCNEDGKKVWQYQEHGYNYTPFELEEPIQTHEPEDIEIIKKKRGRPAKNTNKQKRAPHINKYREFVALTMKTLDMHIPSREKLRICAKLWQESQKKEQSC
jgi:hypothetical protein